MLDVSDVYIYIHTNTYINIDTCIYIRCIACESGIAYWNGIKPGLRAQTGAGETYSHNLPKKTGQAQPWTERKKGGHRSNHKHKATCCLPANSTRNTKHQTRCRTASNTTQARLTEQNEVYMAQCGGELCGQIRSHNVCSLPGDIHVCVCM